MPTATATKSKPAAKRATKPAAKKTTARKPAAKASGAPKDLIELTVDKLTPSPLNPRKAFDQAGIDELAASLKTDGRVFQNLVARKWTGKGKATHEIIAGERRFRAVSQLVKAGDWPADRPVPVLVIEADDAKVIELAIVENVQRRDLTPLEEARSFAQLRGLGHTTDQIADAVSMSLRHVQVRLQLVDTLTPPAQDAMDRGDITLAQARALMLAKDADRQNSLLTVVLKPDYIGDEWTPDQIRERILHDTIPETTAIFPVEEYTGSFIVDTADGDLRYFEDVAQFETLQEAAVSQLEATLKAKWSWVKLVRGYFSSYDYQSCDDGNRADAGAVLQIDYDHSVTVHDGLVPRSNSLSGGASSATASTTKQPQPAFTKKHLIYAHKVKTAVLQGAVAKNPRTAKILACIALMGGRDAVRIRDAERGSDDNVVAGSVVDALTDVAEKLPAGLWYKHRGSDPVKLGGDYSVDREVEAEAYEALKALTDERLDQLFAGLVARRVGTYNGYSPELGDPPLVCALATDLKIDMSKHWLMDTDYLQLPKKPRLLEIIEAGSPSDDADMKSEREKMTGAQLRTAITLRAHMVLPREMQFGSEADLKEAKAINFGPAASAKTAE